MEQPRRLRWTLLVLTAVVAQVSVVGHLALAGVRPDLTLALTVAAGLVAGPRRGAVVGFCSGMLWGASFAAPWGLTAFVWVLVGFASGVAEEVVNAQSRLGCALFVLGGSAGGQVLYAVVSALFGQESPTRPDVGRIVGVVGALNALLAVPVISSVQWAEGETSHHMGW